MSKLWRGIGVGTVAAVITVLGLSAFSAAAPVAAAGVTSTVNTVVAHGGGGRYGEAALTAAADMLGLTVEDLQTQLRAGESLADLAEAAGVNVDDLLAAMDAATLEATRAAIEQAVSDGDLTREKADWLLDGLDNGYWEPGAGGPGFGPGGRGGRGGPGFFAPPAEAPATEGTDA